MSTNGSATGETTRAEGVRARARHQMREAILETARSHLAEHGAVGLSLRAVARDVGMVSSALYRYFDSRDALLTALIIDAYDSLGDAVEEAEGACERDDLLARWLAIAVTTRTWALADPHQYALVYGSPVPGYAAPTDTVTPATRVTRLLAALLVDVEAAGLAPEAQSLPPAVVEAVAPAREYTGGHVGPDLMVRGLMAWTSLFGAVSFELFGQRHNAVADDRLDDFFTEETNRIARLIGLT